MQIAVLSDLHLGRHDALDRNTRGVDDHARAIADRVARVARSVDRVVLLGDVLETLRPEIPLAYARELRLVLDAHPWFARLLDDPKYVYVHGNHDVVAARVLGVPDRFVVEQDGLRVLFFHGHQLDPLAVGPAPVSRAGVWLGGWFERVGIPFTQVRDRAPSTRPTAGPTLHDRLAAAVGRARGYDVVVNGHTHMAGSHEVGSVVVCNSGANVRGRGEMLLIDTKSKTFDVVVDD